MLPLKSLAGFSMQASSTAIVFVTAYYSEFDWQGQIAKDPAHDRRDCRNTVVGIDNVLSGFQIEDNSSARRVFIFDVQRNHPGMLKIAPKCNVAFGVAYTVGVGFGR